MLNELKDLAQKKSKAEKAVQNYIKKKEEERIRKGVQSDKLEEFFEPVTKAIQTTPAVVLTIVQTTTAVGQLIPIDQPIPNIMDTPVPDEPPAIQGPSGYSKQDAQVTEIEDGGVNIYKYDAEKQLENTDLSDEEKLKKIKAMKIALGLVKSNSEFPQEIENLKGKNTNYRKKLNGKMGKGLESKGSYKLDTNGFFSNLLLDLEQLFEYNRLYGLDKKGQRVNDTPVDDDFIGLVTKRYNPKQKYSNSAKRTFRNLVTLSSHLLVKSSGKYKNILCRCRDPVSLVDRLELLIAGIEAGNTSDEPAH